VLPEWTLRDGIIHAVIPSCRGLALAVRSFIDYLADEFARETRSAATSAPDPA
jgi:hypothetical protein